MLVVFDTTNSMTYTDQYNVKVGMFGLDAIRLAVPKDMRAKPAFAGYKSGGRQTLTEDMNTSISAISILRQIPDNPIFLVTYHNHFSRTVLNPDWLRPVIEHQFCLTDPDGKHLPDWMEI